MANGYLGKISAVVSANTADFQGKLNAAARDVQKFASSMQGSLSSAQAGSSSALRGIYTDAQKLERALTAISTRKLSFRGFADKDINTAVGRMQALYSATEQINKPLAAAAKTFGKLPAEIQGAFLPALISSQKAAESLADEINRTGKVSEQRFDAVAAKIDRTTAAMSRLKEASSLVAGLSTGKELAFQRPEMVAETRRSASIQSEIGKLPPESIRGYAELVAQQRAAAVETERLASALEKAKLSRNGDVAAATAAYQSQVAAQRQLNDEIERRVQTEADASRRAAAAADNEIVILIRREQAAKAAEQARLRSRDFTLGSAAPQQRDLGLFGTPATRGAEEAINRAKQLSAEFEKLPDAAKRSIAGLAQIAGRLSNDLQSGKADAAALNQVLDRLETSVRSLSAAEQQRAAAAQARQRALVAEIAQNDRLITQERELAAARQAEMAASRQQEAGSLDAAEQALIGPRRLQERPLNEVYAGLGRQAQDFRGAVDSTFGLPQFREFSDQARRAAAEIQSIKSEIQRLSTLDPQRDAAEYADAWGRVGTRVRAVSDLIAAGTRMAQTAAGGTPPEPPEIIDRNQDRLGAFSPMDRNAGNIGARSSLRGVGDRTDISDMGRSSSLEDRRRQLARQAVGDDIEAPRRQLASLASGITSLKSQLDGLPDSIRTRFVPAIRHAEAEFIRLSAAPGTLPGAIDAARQRVQQLSAEATRATQAMNFSQSFGGAGAAGLNLGLDQRALQGYSAQLQIIQGAIGRASAEARGPAVAAFERLRAAVSTAFDEGRLDTAATREELARLRQQAVAAAAAVGGIRVGSLTRDVARAGDIGRGGFDKFSLALNQAGYAIDDFMSSTGGLEFKLRAVSNNITQLAFILGGTTGLFVGLGAVIAGQAAVAFIKWANNGRSAEDQAKSLNDALARQKTLVDDLAQSHKTLADAIMRGTASSSSEQARTIASGRASLRRQSAELSSERREGADSAAIAPQSISQTVSEFYSPRERRNEFQGIAELRAEINKLQKQLESAATFGERATIQGRIRETNRSLLATRGRLASEQTPDATVVESALRGSADSSERAYGATFGDTLGSRNPNQPRQSTAFSRINSQRAFSDIITLGGATLLGVNRARYNQQAAANEGLRELASQSPTSMQGQIEALRRAQELKRPEASQRDYGFIRTSAAIDAEEQVAKFEAMIQSLQKAVDSGIVDAASKTYAASADAAESIRAAQEDVADAIKRGVPNAIAFQSELDKLSSELASAEESLRAAVTVSPDDPKGTQDARKATVNRAQDRVDEVLRQRADVERRAREVRLGRTFGGERTTQALSSLEGSDRFVNEQAGLIARLKRVVDDEVQARRKASEAAGREAAIVDLIAKKRAEADNAGGDVNKRRLVEADIEAAQADLEKAKKDREAASAASDLAQKASEAAAALADAAAGIESALTRIRKVGESALQKSEQGADAAQRAFEENPLRAGGREARDAAEERLINDRATIGNAQADLDNRRRAIQQNPQMQAVNGELEAITQSRKDLEAKSAIGGGLNAAETAQLDAAVKRETELIRQREMMTRQLTEAERKQLDAINNGIAAREKEIERNRQLTAEDPAFKRRMDAANQITSESERQANEAQQRYINNPTEKNLEERQVADRRLMEDRKRAQELQQKLDEKRTELAKSPEFMANEKAIAENDAMLAELAQKDAASGLEPHEQSQQMELRRKNRLLRSSNDEIIENGTKGSQYSIDQIRISQNKRDRALRGRDLGMTERERFKKEFEEGAGADINARAAELRDKGENPNAFLRQAVFNQMESVAPMMKQFEDERQNARLQGPSRAALNVSDVSTSQGASELTRLLRGDDSAKDVNLAELRKQSDKLDEVVKAIREGNPGVLL